MGLYALGAAQIQIWPGDAENGLTVAQKTVWRRKPYGADGIHRASVFAALRRCAFCSVIGS